MREDVLVEDVKSDEFGQQVSLDRQHGPFHLLRTVRNAGNELGVQGLGGGPEARHRS